MNGMVDAGHQNNVHKCTLGLPKLTVMSTLFGNAMTLCTANKMIKKQCTTHIFGHSCQQRNDCK